MWGGIGQVETQTGGKVTNRNGTNYAAPEGSGAGGRLQGKNLSWEFTDKKTGVVKKGTYQEGSQLVRNESGGWDVVGGTTIVAGNAAGITPIRSVAHSGNGSFGLRRTWIDTQAFISKRIFAPRRRIPGQVFDEATGRFTTPLPKEYQAAYATQIREARQQLGATMAEYREILDGMPAWVAAEEVPKINKSLAILEAELRGLEQ